METAPDARTILSRDDGDLGVERAQLGGSSRAKQQPLYSGQFRSAPRTGCAFLRQAGGRQKNAAVAAPSWYRRRRHPWEGAPCSASGGGSSSRCSAARRRVAARGAGAAGRAREEDRRAHDLGCGRSGRTGPSLGARAGTSGIRLGRSAATCGSTTRWGEGDAERYRRYVAELVALAPDVILVNGPAAFGAGATGNPQLADRVHECLRPGGRRVRRQRGPAGWQRHRFYAV